MKTQSVVRDRAATLASSVFRSKFIVGLMLVPFFKSSFYDSFGMLSDLSNYVLIVETIILILMAFVCEYRSRILIAVGAYFAWTSFIAPALGGSISPGVYYMFEALGFSVLVLLGLRSSGLAFLNALSGWFCFSMKHKRETAPPSGGVCQKKKYPATFHPGLEFPRPRFCF